MSVQVSCADMRDPGDADADSVFTPMTTEVEGRTLDLRAGEIDHVQYAWARLTDARPGDSIWLEISGDGGRHWIQCGRRTIHAGDARNYTDAKRTEESHDLCMRAVTQLAPHHTDKWC